MTARAISIIQADEAQARATPIGPHVRAYNYLHVGEYPEARGVWFNACDADGTLLGGLRGVVALYWLRVELLWVHEAWRRSGLGARLLAAAETRGRELGARHAGVETFDWQAPDFYRKQGYVQASCVADYIDGHALFFFRKPLQEEAA